MMISRGPVSKTQHRLLSKCVRAFTVRHGQGYRLRRRLFKHVIQSMPKNEVQAVLARLGRVLATRNMSSPGKCQKVSHMPAHLCLLLGCAHLENSAPPWQHTPRLSSCSHSAHRGQACDKLFKHPYRAPLPKHRQA